MFQTIQRYEETGLGLPYPVVLIDSAEAELDASGEVVGVAVPDLEGLAAAVVVARCVNPLQLAGEEVRFIRDVLDMSGRELAQAMELDHATLSRWEHGKQPVGAWAEKQVRHIALLSLLDRVPGLHVNPKDVVGLPVVPRAPGEWPQITMQRVVVQTAGGATGAGWDNFRLAA
jgi:hypothetical protein